MGVKVGSLLMQRTEVNGEKHQKIHGVIQPSTVLT